MIRWLRNPEIDANPAILSGLIDLCRYLRRELGGYAQMKIMYEIGSFAGESAEQFAAFFSMVHCVDPWGDSVYAITGQNSKYSIADVETSFDEMAAAAGNVVKHKCRGMDIVGSVPDGSLDFVYIDANHTFDFALADLRAWWPKIRSGGFIGGHDLIPDQPGSEVQSACKAFFGFIPATKFADSSWVERKP